jgi:hypothetical protein
LTSDFLVALLPFEAALLVELCLFLFALLDAEALAADLPLVVDFLETDLDFLFDDSIVS